MINAITWLNIKGTLVSKDKADAKSACSKIVYVAL